MQRLLVRLKNPIRGAAIRVDRVVVVDVTAGVDVPRVVRVTTISGAQADVLRTYSLQPYA